MRDRRDENDGIVSDVVSDPARDDEVGSDWTDEGGASPQGPATSTGSANKENEADEEDDEDDEDGGADGEASGDEAFEPTGSPPPAITLDPPD